MFKFTHIMMINFLAIVLIFSLAKHAQCKSPFIIDDFFGDCQKLNTVANFDIQKVFVQIHLFYMKFIIINCFRPFHVVHGSLVRSSTRTYNAF